VSAFLACQANPTAQPARAVRPPCGAQDRSFFTFWNLCQSKVCGVGEGRKTAADAQPVGAELYSIPTI